MFVIWMVYFYNAALKFSFDFGASDYHLMYFYCLSDTSIFKQMYISIFWSRFDYIIQTMFLWKEGSDHLCKHFNQLATSCVILKSLLPCLISELALSFNSWSCVFSFATSWNPTGTLFGDRIVNNMSYCIKIFMWSPGMLW